MKGDLPIRLASAAVMIAVAALALWLGGIWFNALVALVAAGVLYEWTNLARRFAEGPALIAWLLGGFVYVGLAALCLMWWERDDGALMLILIVIATDSCAYFAGRAIGGPKIAPAISPSKTWAGLLGGMVGSGVALVLFSLWLASHGTTLTFDSPHTPRALLASPGWVAALFMAGAWLAIVAQAGDFFESWMKRRAGVKDSGALIPGHGGLFDRVDGLLAASIGATLMAMLIAFAGAPV